MGQPRRERKRGVRAQAEHAQQIERLNARMNAVIDQIQERGNELASCRAQLAQSQRAHAIELSRRKEAERVPRQIRRVVRTIILTGDPEWVAATLAKSLGPGITQVGKDRRLEVIEGEDRTVETREMFPQREADELSPNGAARPVQPRPDFQPIRGATPR
jgi:hypothetical protein